jgi:methylenetetrahydrofolate dehydrogenase (NADP+)/methenyltetrahydrofolate cyclohydrolase
MAANLLEGSTIAREVYAGLGPRIAALAQRGIKPGLAAVIVGDDPASASYVRNKVRACTAVGLHSEVIRLAGDVSEEALLGEIDRLNRSEQIHGILVQLPLPRGIRHESVFDSIAAHKDVDGFSRENLGALVRGQPRLAPCTPLGVMRMIEHARIPVAGRHAVIVGRSTIVGKPMALLLIARGATVTVCNSKTPDLGMHTLMADILVVAAGRPRLITAGMIKDGAVVIDVGINRAPDGRLVGDVDFEAVRDKASWISPVPGGVGPMTVAMLIANTVTAAELAAAKRQGADSPCADEGK